MFQPGFFDLDNRMRKIDSNGDPLTKINQAVDWEIFRPALEKARQKPRKSTAGPKGYDVILLFKILVLQSLYNLSDDATEYQILDRHSFCRFLGLHIGSKVPDATTIWLFREDLKKAGIIEELFSQFELHLQGCGYTAMKGQIVDASIVKTPIQRNSREENEQIKRCGKAPVQWGENKRRRKDVDARWTRKNGKSFFGYKNHISIDAKHKFIRGWKVTDASVHDSNIFEEILAENTNRTVWADSAYYSKDRLKSLEQSGYRECILRKGNRSRKLTAREQHSNRTKSKVRVRVEHVFGVQSQKAGNLLIRTVGLTRAKVKIGMRNLAYNMDRLGT
ncbi:MAG: IS5/IS1182 family transposase [Deltaproteobacteria bacterium]|nr:MAG: IS5/IS1182 family transposase [Deltaproteobacteria bacterium]